jgi:hypothetical protein
MIKKSLLICFCTLLFSGVFAQTWRSSLYPENWLPGFKDAESRFLHDFSYAGYRSGDVALPVITANLVDVTKAPYFADNKGISDARQAIQQAIDNVGKAGGGVVFMPEGTYKINVSATANNALKINYSNVVLRGAGAYKTFIFNENSNIRGLSVITIRPVTGGDWVYSGTNSVTITSDLLEPAQVIPVSSVAGYKVGDWVVLRADVTTGFIDEHQMAGLWGTSMVGPIFYRTIVAINAAANTLKIDAPTRYFLKKRDNARVLKVTPVLSEVGLEHFSIANKQTTIAGLGDLDFSKSGTGAYEIHGSQLIGIFNAVNCWIRNVNTYKPAENAGDFHLVSNGILLQRTRFVTVESCFFQKPQYEGEGGNGYMFILGGNDCLIKNTHANHGRHNFDFKTMQASGNVILRCRGENSRLASDFHMHLSMSNLFDNFTANKDFLEAKFRPYGTSPSMHGHPTTQSVFWNTRGEAYPSGKTAIVESSQYGWGYVIGTRGAASAVKTTPVSGTTSGYPYNTSPEDFKEGIGKGDQLEPESLYEDQLKWRIARNSVQSSGGYSLSDEHVLVYPNPTSSGILNVESTVAIDGYQLINLNGKVVAETKSNNGTRLKIAVSERGFYMLVLNVSGKLVVKKVLVS